MKADGTAVPAGVWRLSEARSLVKLLALVEGNSMHRDAVVEALWPDLGAAAAVTALRECCSLRYWLTGSVTAGTSEAAEPRVRGS